MQTNGVTNGNGKALKVSIRDRVNTSESLSVQLNQEWMRPVKNKSFFDGQVTLVLMEVKVSALKVNPYNPVRRNQNPIKLRKSVKKAGGVLCPLIVWQDGTIYCGHGRYEAARQEGLEYVWALVAFGKKEEMDSLYIEEMKTRPFAGRDKMNAIAKGAPRELSKAAAKANDDFCRYFSKEELTFHTDNGGINPAFVNALVSIANVVANVTGRPMKATYRALFLWALKYSAQEWLIKRLLSYVSEPHKAPWKTFIRRVDENKPYQTIQELRDLPKRV